MTVRDEYVRRCRASDPPEPAAPAFERRPPRPADAEALTELMLDAYRGTIDDDGETLTEARAEVKRYFESEADSRPMLDDSRLAVRGEVVLGACLVSWWEARDRPMIGYVMTRAEAKRQGIGGALVAESVAALCTAGHEDVRAVITAGNVPSERLFGSLGFERANP